MISILRVLKKIGSAKSLPIFFLPLPLLLCSCATYQDKLAGPRQLIRAGQMTEAIEQIEKLATENSGDQLLYLLDYAMALQIAGRYQESSRAFIKADELAEMNDYHSVSRVLGATLGGEESVQYKGESYEKFMINTFNALNFLMMDDYEGALVEARRINEKINKMRMDGREDYEQSPFARYLSSILWQASGNMDSAYIELEAAYKLDPTIPDIQKDLIRLSKRSRRDEAYKKWKKEFSDIKEETSWSDRNSGELVFIFHQGWGPEKRPRPESPRFPMLVSTYSQVKYARISSANFDQVSQTTYNIDSVAKTTLEKDYGSLVARRVGGVVAKEVVADQIRQKNEMLGAIAWIVMHASDRADLRNWSTLPQQIQTSRKILPAGKHTILIEELDAQGMVVNQVEKVVEIKPGKVSFINHRSLR